MSRADMLGLGEFGTFSAAVSHPPESAMPLPTNRYKTIILVPTETARPIYRST